MMQLTRSNFETYAAKYYDNPHCESDEEFKEDLLHFKYLRRLISQYVSGGKLNERLLLNHIIIIHNLFGIVPGSTMIVFKSRGNEEIIKPFLNMLNALPEVVSIDGETINTDTIVDDPIVVEALRKI